MKIFTFVIKHKSGVTNQVADALSRRCSLLTKMKVKVLGFDEMKVLYNTNFDFFEMWRECIAPSFREQLSKFGEYFIQESM